MRDGDAPLLAVLFVGLLVLLGAMAATGRLERLTNSVHALSRTDAGVP
ncbi:MAG: hypothetical protein ABTQ32_24425 [Myxococcaceae bacterium]